ncbi:MAG: TolC family protein [Phycisphaerae bacterium]|nr:TolC family protein [Phycisphaerae bacterium]
MSAFQMSNVARRLATVAVGLVLLAGCELFTNDADREVYRLVESRQNAALGVSRNVRIDGADASRSQAWTERENAPYAFAPNPVDSTVPESFLSATTQPTTEPAATATPATQPTVPDMTLADALAYAFRHSREFQSAKEELYLAALRLTLERHLWTPRFVGEISSLFTDYEREAELDQTLESVASVGVEQRLPFGGELTARVLNRLVNDLHNGITTAETGEILIEANIPLLRGAGPAAYETRYQAERDLIYAVRTFERFRRSLAVDIAGNYFNLQQLRQAIVNANKSVEGFTEEANRARALWRTGRLIELEAQRADQNRLEAINGQVNAVERYQTAVDQFKIRIGMPIETPIGVPLPVDPGGAVGDEQTQPADPLIASLRLPVVPEEEAIIVALKQRLDLINDFDRIGDAERGVSIAKNDLLPDLRALSSVLLSTDAENHDSTNYSHERLRFSAGATLELPLDRKAERNALRESQIRRERAERDYEEARDLVVLQVRRSIRRVQQQQESFEIQILNRDLAIERGRAARIRAIKGELSNRDVVEAEQALLVARNQLAEAQAQLSLEILQFWRDTGTLRIDDDGAWTGFQPGTEDGELASKTVQ